MISAGTEPSRITLASPGLFLMYYGLQFTSAAVRKWLADCLAEASRTLMK